MLYDKNDYYAYSELEKKGKDFKKNFTKLKHNDFGAGSKVFKGEFRRVSEIYKYGISKEKFSKLYFRIVNKYSPEYAIELGTSIGLNTVYLAKAKSSCKLYSLEGSQELSHFAKDLLNELSIQNVEIVSGDFDDELPGLLKKIPRLDFLFVDGNHRYEPTLRYFHMCAEKAGENSIFIFDDIRWSEEMKKAWDEIRNDSRVTSSIDLFDVGIVFFNSSFRQKEHFSIRF